MRECQRMCRQVFRACGVVALLFASGCSPAGEKAARGAGRSVVQVEVGGVARSYILRVPPAYDGVKQLPLVLLLHGATDSAAYAEEAYHFAEKADAEGFLLVLPDALGAMHAWHGLDADDAGAPNNDLAFLNEILAEVPRRYAVDGGRVYVCGHSSGAIMAYRLAAERPDAIAAAGIVAGTVGDTRSVPARMLPTPKGPVPLIVFHGRRDPVLPFDGGNPGVASVAESVAFWCRANHCGLMPARTEHPVREVQVETFTSAVGAEIVLYTVENGNHMWPGGKIMPGKDQEPVQEISATDRMWEFFVAHPKAAGG